MDLVAVLGGGAAAVLLAAGAIAYKLYGTLNIVSILSSRKQYQQLETEHERLFSQREQMLYHADWAKDRGEAAEESNLRKQIELVDQRLDELDSLLEPEEEKQD